MTDEELSKRLADAASSLAPERVVDAVPIAARARRSHQQRRTARLGVLAVLAVVGGALGIGRLVGSEDPAVETTAEGSRAGVWERLPDPPLSPRVGATAAWNGDEVVVVGGWEYLCPPAASCAGPEEPAFSDGAAFDPSARQWRSIAAAPTGFSGETAVAVAGDVYLLVPCDAADACAPTNAGVAFIRYDAGADEWAVLEPPPNGRDYELAPAGRFVVAYAGSDESGEVPDFLFDTGSSTWQEIPDDPFPPTFDRTIVTRDEGETLILIAAPIEGPSEPVDNKNVVARLDVASGGWEELPPPPGRGYRGWGVDDVVVLEPHFGGHGGALDPVAQAWSDLPLGPDADGWENQIAGVIGRTDAVYKASTGWLLDLAESRWVAISPPDERETFPDSNVTAVGRDLFLYGGERWQGSEGELLGDAWIWRAPRDGGDDEPAPTPSPTSPTSAPQPGQLVIELVDPPLYFEGYDLAVRVTPAGGATIERRLDDFITDAGQRPGFAESSSLTVDISSGSVAVQAHLTIGPGGGPREPDFVDQFDGSLCSAVEIRVPADGVATAQMDWQTGCLESPDAPPPADSDLVPSRPPEASGVLVGPYPGDTDQRSRLTVSSGQPESFNGAILDLGEAVIVRGGDGAEGDAEEVSGGIRVEVWMTGCDESDPLACSVQVIRTRR